MSAVENFILDQDEVHRQLLIQAHELVMSFTNVTTALKWGIPVYYHKKYFGYINPIKKKPAIEVCFIKGKQLKDPAGLLSLGKRKMVMGCIIYEFTDDLIENLSLLIKEAIELNA